MTCEATPPSWLGNPEKEHSASTVPSWLNVGATQNAKGCEPEADPSVLFVCTGNICRSAFAACSLADMVADKRMRVDSAGVGALEGSLIDSRVARLAERMHVPTGSHIAKQLTGRDLMKGDVVLTFGPEHQQWILDNYPDQYWKVMPFRLFVSEAEVLLRSERLCWNDLIRKTLNRVVDQNSDNWIEDPYNRSSHVYESVVNRIYAYVKRMNEIIDRVG